MDHYTAEYITRTDNRIEEKLFLCGRTHKIRISYLTNIVDYTD